MTHTNENDPPRTMRALAAAFVTGDRAAFESIVDEARKLQ